MERGTSTVKDGLPSVCNERAAKLTKTIRVEVDKHAVGNGVTDKGTRTNQEEPRTSIARLRADEQPEWR